ncbi:hypothetical protein [Streptomyces sp. YKOK-I1]
MPAAAGRRSSAGDLIAVDYLGTVENNTGHMMFYASDTTGEFSRYRWSVNSAKSTNTWPVSAARIV